MTEELCMSSCHISSVKTVENCRSTWKRNRQGPFYVIINDYLKDISKAKFIKVDNIYVFGVIICLEIDICQGTSSW